MTSPQREKSVRKRDKNLASHQQELEPVRAPGGGHAHPAQQSLAGRTVESIQHHLGNQFLTEALGDHTLSGLHQMAAEALDLGIAGIENQEYTPGLAPISAMRSRLQAKRRAAPGLDTAAQARVLSTIGTRQGEPLPRAVQARMESAFGKDFGNVRVHTDGAAAQSATAINARAFTTGSHIFFGPGEWNPQSVEGMELLAHELTHVLQADEGRLPHPTGEGLAVSHPSDATEKEAEARARDVVHHLHSAQDPSATAAAEQDAPTISPSQVAAPAAAPAAAPLMLDEDASSTSLQAGVYTKVELSLSIPTTVPGLTVDVTISGKYTESNEGGTNYIEAEGLVRIAITYKVLFLTLSVFGQGSLKFKVKTNNFNDAMAKGFEDVSHWFAARELADLPARKSEIVDEYSDFEKEITSLCAGLMGDSPSERVSELDHIDDGIWDNALKNIIDARSELVENVREIFQDMDGDINGAEIYPSTTWIRDQLVAHLADSQVSSQELTRFWVTLLQESKTRRQAASDALFEIPAVDNNPDVEFEGNLQVGVKAGITVSDNLGGEVELGRGWRISDSMGSESFDTNTSDVWFASISVTGKANGLDLSGQLQYEGVGGTMTEPDSFSISGNAMVGVGVEDVDPNAHSDSLQQVKSRLQRAFTGGQNALHAVFSELKSAIADTVEPKWKTAAKMMVGIDAKLAFKKGGDGYSMESGKNQLKFVTVQKIEAKLGVASGSIETGTFVGISF